MPEREFLGLGGLTVKSLHLLWRQQPPSEWPRQTMLKPGATVMVGWGHRGWGGVGAGLAIGALAGGLIAASTARAYAYPAYGYGGYYPASYGYGYGYPASYGYGYARLGPLWSFGVGLSLRLTTAATTRPAMAMAAITAGMASVGWAIMAAITRPRVAHYGGYGVRRAGYTGYGSVVATASALVQWAAGAEPRRVVLESIETLSREGSGAHRPHLSPRYPSRRGFFVPSGTFVNLEGSVATRKHPLPPLRFRDFSPARIDLPRRGFSLLPTFLVRGQVQPPDAPLMALPAEIIAGVGLSAAFCVGPFLAVGRSNRKMVPFGSAGRVVSFPSCRSTIVLQIARPNPIPRDLVVTNGSNTLPNVG